MKNILLVIILSLTFTFTFTVGAEVIAPSDDSLQDDLNFALDNSSLEQEREVASEEQNLKRDEFKTQKGDSTQLKYWEFSEK